MPESDPVKPSTSTTNTTTKKDVKLKPKQPTGNIGFGGPSHKPNPANPNANEQLFWAKGTGFGTGSTTSDWNIENAVKKQKQEEQYITAILQVSFFVFFTGFSVG